MEAINNCKEITGLFIVRDCTNLAEKKCKKCGKEICREHTFVVGDSKFNNSDSKMSQGAKLCLTCFTSFDTRLTKEIELYSKDRAIWRRKMMERFHKEYPYMQFVAKDYGTLFNATSPIFSMHSDNDDAYFDS